MVTFDGVGGDAMFWKTVVPIGLLAVLIGVLVVAAGVIRRYVTQDDQPDSPVWTLSHCMEILGKFHPI